MMKYIMLPMILLLAGTGAGCTVRDLCNESIGNKDYDRAIIECSRQIEGEKAVPHLDFSYNRRGIAYNAKKEYDLAIADYDKAIALNPSNSTFFGNRGNTYQRKGLFDLAFADLDKAIALAPGNYFAYNTSGFLYLSKGEVNKAIADFNRSIELNPDFHFAYLNRGNAYRRLGQNEQAISDFNKSIELHPEYDALNARGNVYKDIGRYDWAAADYNQAIGLNPLKGNAFISRGFLNEAQGNYDQAIGEYLHAIELNPGYEYPYLQLVIATLLAKKDSTDARVKLQEFVSRNSTTKWIRTVSRYYLKQDKIDEQAVLQEARRGKDSKEVNERLCEAYYYLAIPRLLAGDRSGAEEFFKKSVDTSVFNFRECSAAKAMLVQMGKGRF